LVVAGAGSGSAMGRQPAGAAADVEVEFIEADGTLRREASGRAGRLSPRAAAVSCVG
jgi:hypothetical protein